jgi:hypothetical protein
VAVDNVLLLFGKDSEHLPAFFPLRNDRRAIAANHPNMFKIISFTDAIFAESPERAPQKKTMGGI